jgi:hypothetical protein
VALRLPVLKLGSGLHWIISIEISNPAEHLSAGFGFYILCTGEIKITNRLWQAAFFTAGV